MGKLVVFFLMLIISSNPDLSSWALESSSKLQHEYFNLSNTKPVQQRTVKFQDLDHISVDHSIKAQRGKGGTYGTTGANIDNKPARINKIMGVYLSTPKTEKVSEDGENGRFRYGLSSMQGWRSTMEDAHAAYLDLDSSTSFFGVYDGHGGQAVAKFCAKHLHEQILNHEAYLAGDISTSAQKTFLRMDEMMCEQRGWRESVTLGDDRYKDSDVLEESIWSQNGSEANENDADCPSEEGPCSGFHWSNCGSTACVAIIQNNKIVVANAGDSRCVISRKGQAIDLSKDHKPDLEVEKERILKAGGFIQVGRVNGTLNLARAIGDMEFKQNKLLPAEKQIVTANPDVTSVELCDDDEFLVLACDGIWDCMSSQQLVDFVREQLQQESKLSVICERVFDKCIAPTAGGEGCDNMTMILVQFRRDAKPNASGKNESLSSNQAPKIDSNSGGTE